MAADAVTPLVDLFLPAVPEGLRGELAERSDLEALLEARLAAARAAWPDVELPAEALLAHAAGVLGAAKEIETLHWSDLYLAVACARGLEAAVVLLDRRYLRDLRGRLQLLGASSDTADEALQAIRVRLLTADAGRAPGIRSYSGQGSLRGWLHVVASREARWIVRRSRRAESFADASLMDVLCPPGDPTESLLKDAHRADVADALRQAADALPTRERNLLRHHLIEGLTVDEVGTLYGVHRATAARWMARAREELLTDVRRRLVRALRISEGDVDSLILLMQSRLDASLERLLEPRGPAE